MPPQQTNISAGIGDDAARRSLTLSIASAKSAVDQALAARLKASAAALDDALSEKASAGPERAPTRSILSLLTQSWNAFREQRRSPRVALKDLSDRDLRDIGLTCDEIDSIRPERAIDELRNRAADLWSRGGM